MKHIHEGAMALERCGARMQWVRLVVVGIVSMIPHNTLQAQYSYRTNKGTITITGYTGPGGAISIPDTLPRRSSDGSFSRVTG